MRPIFVIQTLKKRKKRYENLPFSREYDAPVAYVGIFYFLLAAWTVVCVFFLGSKTLSFGWPVSQLLMIAFVLGYTWYFSLGIAYKVAIDGAGNVLLSSFRRQITVNTESIDSVEGPRLTIISYCFIRFKLEREKAYLFCCITDEDLHQVLCGIRRANQHTKFKGLPMIN